MLPKTQSEMFSKSLVNKMVLMIVPKEILPNHDVHPDYENKDGVPPLLDRNGDEWMLMGIFLVKEDAVFIGDVDAEGIPMINDDPEGVFVEADMFSKDIWDLGVLRDLVTQSDDERTLTDIQSDFIVEAYKWAFIHPYELYNTFFRKSAINYQQIL